jgi:hypothetical protein
LLKVSTTASSVSSSAHCKLSRQSKAGRMFAVRACTKRLRPWFVLLKVRVSSGPSIGVIAFCPTLRLLGLSRETTLHPVFQGHSLDYA